jgi:hypothetical protein
MGEITVRNKEMFDYIFTNDLYNREGISAVITSNGKNLLENAPYQAEAYSVDKQTGVRVLSKIDFPTGAIMIKSNWLCDRYAEEMGLKDDPAAPYIKKIMITETDDGKCGSVEKGGVEHWLLSFHISTKDVPQWIWTTFEHVNNPGRCDFTGCNDSYGYESADQHPPGTAANFTKPRVRNDGLKTSTVIYDIGERYGSGPISKDKLAPILAAMKIGTTSPPAGQPAEPTATDRAWLSYRLKGSQVNFTNTMGRPTRLGNAITEGGFMATSSCISCHARAAVSNAWPPGGQPLGIFLYDALSEVGYRQSAVGVPQPDWFHGSGLNPTLLVLPADFVWGMPLLAKPLAAAK